MPPSRRCRRYRMTSRWLRLPNLRAHRCDDMADRRACPIGVPAGRNGVRQCRRGAVKQGRGRAAAGFRRPARAWPVGPASAEGPAGFLEDLHRVDFAQGGHGPSEVAAARYPWCDQRHPRQAGARATPQPVHARQRFCVAVPGRGAQPAGAGRLACGTQSPRNGWWRRPMQRVSAQSHRHRNLQAIHGSYHHRG